MKVIIAWDGDHIGREVGRASLADDVDGLRRISQAIDRGNEIWKSWVIMNGGSMISYGGDEGRAEILAEKLGELPKVRDQYASAVQSSVSVGVGTKLSEADRALMVAKIRGGDKIVLYSPDLEPEIEQAVKAGQQRTEADKLSQEYLGKADGPQEPQSPAMVEGSAAGFKGASPPSAPSIDTPQVEASEHSQGEAAQAQVDNQPPGPESTHAAADFEDMFHDAAAQQDQKDQGQPVGGDPNEQIKSQLVQVLQVLKTQMPILEQIKQSAPDTYQAVMGLTQIVIAMAKQLNGDPTHQTAKETEDRARSQAQVEVPLPPEEQEASDKGKDSSSKADDSKESSTKKSEKAYKLEGDALIEVDPKTGKSLGKGPINKDEMGATKAHDCKEFGHCWGTGAAKDHCLVCKIHVDEALDKASLSPNAGQKAPAEHHHLNLPVGTHVDPGPTATRKVGRIKVEHPDTGKDSWVQARAGQILSQDGHAISSRNPGGK